MTGLLSPAGLTRVGLPLDGACRQVLGPFFALHGHRPGCPGGVDVGVGLLLQTVETLAGAPPRLVVRPGADPPLWLRLPDAEVALGILDACCLLCSQRLTIAIEETGDDCDA